MAEFSSIQYERTYNNVFKDVFIFRSNSKELIRVLIFKSYNGPKVQIDLIKFGKLIVSILPGETIPVFAFGREEKTR